MKKHKLEEYLELLRKAFKSPGVAATTIKALIVGTLYIIYYRVFRRNVKTEFPLFVYRSWIRITGPGKVHIGRNCHVLRNALQGLTIVTLSRHAQVLIGEECSVGGATIRCMERIEIGKNTFTSNCLIQDCLFVTKTSERSHPINKNDTRPILFGKNVWIGQYGCVLGGSVIGNDCTVSYQSVCHGLTLADYCVGLGNPIRKGIPVPFIKRLRAHV